VEIPYEQRFHFHDGSSAANLLELKRKIETVSYDEFYRHVNGEKNDFASWVEHVLGRKLLAQRLRAVTSIVETVELLNEELYPQETGIAEEALVKEGEEDLQRRIEEQLFADLELPTDAVDELPDLETPERREERELLDEGEHVVLPPREHVEFAGRMPGAPVTTRTPGHTPVTERVDKPVSAEEHMKFIVKQFIYGLLAGLVIGFFLGRLVSV